MRSDCGNGGISLRRLHKASRRLIPIAVFDVHGGFRIVFGGVTSETRDAAFGSSDGLDLVSGGRRCGVGAHSGRWLPGTVLHLHGRGEFGLDAVYAAVVLWADRIISEVVAGRTDRSGNRGSWLRRGCSRER